jgi:hypothetical protein
MKKIKENAKFLVQQFLIKKNKKASMKQKSFVNLQN